MASTHPTATGGPSQHAAGNSNPFLRASSSTNIAPTPRSSSLPLSFSLPRMGLTQSKPQPSTPTSSSAKGSISAAVAGGIKLKRAFAARRKKTGEGSSRDVSPSPAAMTPIHSQALPSQLQQQQHQQRPTFTTSPLSAPSNIQSNQAQAPQQQAVSSIQRFNLQNHPPSPTLTLSLPPLSKQQSQQQLGTSGRHPQSPTRGFHSIPNVPGAFSSPPSSSGLVQSPLHSELPLTTGGSSPSPTMSQQQSQNAMLTPPSTSTSMATRAINRSSVIPLSPGITSAVTYISMLDRQQEALENKEKEKEEAEKERELERQKAQEEENAEREQQQRKQLPVPPSQPSLQRQDSQPTRRQLPTPPTTSLISNPVAATPATSTVVVTESAAASQQATSPSQSSTSSPTPTSTPLPTPSLSSTAPTSDVTSPHPAPSLASTATDLTSTSMAALPPKAESKDKESWRKSDSTNSYHTIRPPRPTLNASAASNRASFTSSPASASPTATSRPVSWAESFQSARTVVQGVGGQAQGQGGRPLSASFVGGGVGMVEESEEEGLSDDDDEQDDDDDDRRRVNLSEIGDGEDSETEESEGESDIGIDNVDTASSVTSASNASSSKTPSLSSGSGAGSNSGKKIVLKRRSMSLGDASQYVTPVSPISAAAHNIAAASSDFSSHSKMKQPSLSISEGVPVPPSSQQQPKLSTKNLKGKLAAWTSASGSGASASSSSKHQQHHHPQERDLPAIPPNTSPASPPSGATFSSGPGAQSLPVWAQHVSQASLGSINSFNSTTSSSYDHQQQADTASSNTRPAQQQQAVFPQQRQASQQSFTQSQPLRQQLHMATSPLNQNLSVPHQHQHQPSRSPAISLTSGGFGLAKRAVEKMGKWGFGGGGSSSSSSAASTSNSAPSSYKDKDYGTGSIGSYSTHSASSASISGGGATGSGSSNSGHPTPPPNSFVQGMSLFGYAIQRVASGSHAHSGGGGSGSGNSSAAEEKLGRKERKEREKREKEREKAGNAHAHMKSPSSVSSAGAESSLGMPVPASPSKRSHHLFGHGHGHGHGHVAGASVSSAFSLDSSSRNAGEHDLQQQQQEGPSLGRPIRAPMIPVSKVKGGGTGGSGLVFKRHLKDCVKETGVWVTSSGRSARREKRDGIRQVDVDEETLALIKELEEERSVPALVVRCAQHLLLWGVQEEGLFRVSGMPSHVSKLRAEFDAGADYDMTECNPGELDPHAVAVVFKAYLRELPEPLLTKKLQHEFDAAIKQENTLNSASDSARTASAGTSSKTGLPSGPKAGLRKPPSLSTLAMPSFHGIPPASAPLLATLRALIRQLPKENRDLALTVVDLIRATAKASKRTKMPLSNLLLVFCPSLGMTPPLLKVLCEGEGIWDEKADSELEAPVDVDEVIDIRRMTIKPADVGKDVAPPMPVIDISKPGDEVEDDGKSRMSVDTADTDNYHASEESADEDEHDAASSSPSLAMSSKASGPAQRRNASVDLRQAEQEMEAEKERRRHARDSEAPTIYMDTRSHLSSSSSSFAPEMTPGAESTKSFAQQQQSSPRSSVVLNNQTGSQRPNAGKQMRRRSIALLSLPGFSPSSTPASSSAASSPGSSGRSSFPSLGNEENSQATTQKTLRTKKPSLKLLFSKMSAAAQGAPSSATVGGKTISGPILHQEDSEDEDEYGQSSISTPISAVTAPQSSIPGPNSSPRLNHKGSRTMLTVVLDNGARSRASSTASSHFPPVLDTPIEDPSLEALDGMLGGFDVSPPDTALLTSSNPTPTTASLSSSATSPTSPPVSSTRRPVIGRGRKQQQQQQDLKTPVVHPHPLAIQPGNNSNVSLESGSSSSSASALSSASSVSLASSHHLSLFEGDEEGQETMEDWTQSVLLAAADVSLGGMDGWEGVGVGVKGGNKGDEERKAQN